MKYSLSRWRMATSDEREDILSAARRMRAYRVPWTHIERKLRVDAETLRRYIDPYFTDSGRLQPGQDFTRMWPRSTAKVRREDYEARLREIPEETRTPAQQLLGDPPLLRSALGRRG